MADVAEGFSTLARGVHDLLGLRNAGTWAAIHHHLRRQVRIKAGRDPDPTVAIIDSQSVKTLQKGGNAATMRASGSRAASGTSPPTRKAIS